MAIYIIFFSFDDLLNADEIKNYIKKQIEEENLTFMFNTGTIPFEVSVIILRSDENTRIFQKEPTEIRNIGSINTEESEEEKRTNNLHQTNI